MNTIKAFFVQNQGNFFDFQERAGRPLPLPPPPPPPLVRRQLSSWLIVAVLLWRLVDILPRAVSIVARGGVRGVLCKCSYNTFKLLSRLVILYRISCCPWYSNVLFFVFFHILIQFLVLPILLQIFAKKWVIAILTLKCHF